MRMRRKARRHEMARGVAVFTNAESPGSNFVKGPLPEGGRLHQWALDHGVDLTDDLASLELLESHLDEWNGDQDHFEHVDLGNEIGVYVGNVILAHAQDSKWRVRPNGHPVIVLGVGRKIDVIAMTNDRVNGKGASLGSIYTFAVAG